MVWSGKALLGEVRPGKVRHGTAVCRAVWLGR